MLPFYEGRFRTLFQTVRGQIRTGVSALSVAFLGLCRQIDQNVCRVHSSHLKKYTKYILIFILPIVALFEWTIEKNSFLFGIDLAYIISVLCFIIGSFLVLLERPMWKSGMIVLSLILAICFWFDVFKSPVIASVSEQGGDLQSFRGTLVLRRNGKCEIWAEGIFDREKYVCTYTMEQEYIVVDGCNNYAGQFKEVIIDSKTYALRTR